MVASPYFQVCNLILKMTFILAKCNFVLGCIIRKSLCFSVGEQTSSSKLLLSINSWSVWLSREKIRLGLRFKTHYICEKSCRKRTPEFIHITTKTNQGNNITCYTSFIIQYRLFISTIKNMNSYEHCGYVIENVVDRKKE